MNAAEGRPEKPQISIWYWLVIPVIVLLLQAFFESQRAEPLAYSDFKLLLKAGKLDDLAVADDAISGSLRAEGLENILPRQKAEALKRNAGDKQPFVTQRVSDPQLIQDLDAARVRYSGQVKSGWLSTLLAWVLPVALLFYISGALARRAGVSSGWAFDVGKSKARVYVENKTGVTFSDVAGIDEAKDELMEVVEFLKNPQRYQRLGGKIPKGVLIVGAPGTGKTLLAKAVAGEAGVPFFSMSGSEFVEMFVGVGAARVRDLFAQAQVRAPCIIFIDELDAVGKARGMGGVVGGYSEHEQTLNQLLVEMDGFDTNKGVIILGATNRPEILDPALLRPGRFDRHITLDRPDLKGREQILRVHVKRVTLAPEVDLSIMAARTAGFAGAELANLVNEAALLAARRSKERVDMKDFDEAIDRIVAGLEKKTRVMNPQEKETVAYHEAGHAVIAEFRKYADRVAKISIIPRGIAALGYTRQLPTEDRYLLKKAELLDRLDVFLGGRVAEELVFGDASTGAQNDLQLATDMARHMVTQYGMSDKLGLITFDEASSPLLYPLAVPQKKAYSENTAQAIDSEIGKLIEQARQRARETLSAQRILLDALAKALLEKESIDRAGLDRLLKKIQRI